MSCKTGIYKSVRKVIGNKGYFILDEDNDFVRVTRSGDLQNRGKAYGAANKLSTKLNQDINKDIQIGPVFYPIEGSDGVIGVRIDPTEAQTEILNSYQTDQELLALAEQRVQDELSGLGISPDGESVPNQMGGPRSPFEATQLYDIGTTGSSTSNTPDEYVSILTQRQTILQSLKAQLKEEINENKIKILKDRIAALSDHINNINDEDQRSFDYLLDMIKGDMNTINKYIDITDDTQSLVYFLSLLHNYPDMMNGSFLSVIESLPRDEKLAFDNTMNEIDRLSSRIRSKIRLAADEISKSYGQQSYLNIDGTPILTADIGQVKTVRAEAAAINHPLIQAINKKIKDALDRERIQFRIFQNSHEKIYKDFQKFQKSRGVSSKNLYDYMIQTDASGKRTGSIVTKYTPEYYEKRSNVKEKPRERLKFFAESHKNFKLNKEAWDQRLARERKLFRDENIDQITLTPEEYSSGLTKEDKLEQAFQKYVFGMDANIMLRIFEAAKKGKLPSENVKFFINYIKRGFLKPEIINGVEVYPIEIEPIDQYLDPKFSAIENMSDTDPRKIFYNHYQDHARSTYRKMSASDSYQNWNYVPEKLKLSGIGNRIKDWSVRSISENTSQRTVITNALGQTSYKIPVYMKGSNLPIEDKSFNLKEVLEEFVREGYRFHEVNSIKNDVDLLMLALDEVQFYEVNPITGAPKKDQNGQNILKKGVSNAQKVIQYTIDAQVYQQAQLQEFVTNREIATPRLKAEKKAIMDKMKKIGLQGEDLETAQKHVLTDIDYTGTNAQITEFVELGKQLKDLSPFFRVLTGSKIGNALLSFTSYRFLGLNLFAGFGEMLQGFYSLNLQASGSRWFSGKQTYKAFGQVMRSMNPTNDPKAVKVRNVIKFYDAVSEAVMGVDMVQNKMSDTAFFAYKQANRLVNGTYLIGRLMNTKIKDLNGNEHSFYDVLIAHDDGTLSLPSNFAQDLLFKNGEPTPFLLKTRQDFREMLAENRDRRNSDDPIILNQSFLGRALGHFKANWMIKGFLLRWGDEYQGNINRRGGKGFYRSAFDLFKVPTTTDITGNVVKDYSMGALSKAFFGGIKELLKQGFIARRLGYKADPNLSEMDLGNIRMFVREMTWALTLTTFGILLSSMLKDNDDDSNEAWYKWALNQSTRLLRDVMTYNSPTSFMSVTDNPMPFISTVKDAYEFIVELGSAPLMMSPNYGWDEWNPGDKFIDFVPAVRQVPRTIDKFTKEINYN